jgi:DNA primase
LMPELARQGQLPLEDLQSLWGGTTTPLAPTRHRPAAGFAGSTAPLRRSGRRAPAAPADLALRLLLRHSDWWERLSADDHHLLHALGGTHAVVVAWLERQLMEHGPQTWAALELAMQEEDWADEARGWVNAAVSDEEQGFDDLHRVVQTLWIDTLHVQANQITAGGATTREELDGLRALLDQVARIKASLMRPPT